MNLNARMQALTASVGTEPGMHDMLMQAQCKYGNRKLGLLPYKHDVLYVIYNHVTYNIWYCMLPHITYVVHLLPSVHLCIISRS